MANIIKSGKDRGETKLDHPWLNGYLMWLRTFHHHVEAQAMQGRPDEKNPQAVPWVSSWVFFSDDERNVELPWKFDLSKVKLSTSSEEMFRAVYASMQVAIGQDLLSEFDGKIADLRPYVASLMGVVDNIPGQPDVVPRYSSPQALFRGDLPTVTSNVTKPASMH